MSIGCILSNKHCYCQQLLVKSTLFMKYTVLQTKVKNYLLHYSKCFSNEVFLYNQPCIHTVTIHCFGDRLCPHCQSRHDDRHDCPLHLYTQLAFACAYTCTCTHINMRHFLTNDITVPQSCQYYMLVMTLPLGVYLSLLV
jgi:hypothetical protein